MTSYAVADLQTFMTDGSPTPFLVTRAGRFKSPVSYRDPSHYGVAVTTSEYTPGAVLLVYYCLPQFKRPSAAS